MSRSAVSVAALCATLLIPVAATSGSQGVAEAASQPQVRVAAAVQLRPAVWELPGAMPEISPSPDFGADIDRLFTERSMALQALGTYGILWPVVHFELGVSPDLGRGAVRVVPQVPAGQRRVSGAEIRLGGASIDVIARRGPGRLQTTVHRDRRMRLRIGAVLSEWCRGEEREAERRACPAQGGRHRTRQGGPG